MNDCMEMVITENRPSAKPFIGCRGYYFLTNLTNLCHLSPSRGRLSSRCLGLLVESHGLDIVRLGLAVVEAAVLGKLVEQLTEAGLIRAGFTPFLIGVARGLGILDHDAVPTLRALNGNHARAVYLLIGPEGVADVVTLEHLHKVALPLHRVMAELSHVHRAADGVAEVDIVGDGLLGGRTAIAVAGVHQFIVVGVIVEHPEETVPVGAA